VAASSPTPAVEAEEPRRPSAREITADLLRRLRQRYQTPQWALLEQVADGVRGWNHRYADVIVMGLFPSRGLSVIGFEIKASRGDWTRELRAPQKADPIVRHCDQWFVVAARDVILSGRQRKLFSADEDLLGALDMATFPAPWGVMVPSGSHELTIAKQAVKLEAPPLDREFVAALLRRAAEESGSKVAFDERVQAEVQAAFDRGQAAGRAHAIRAESQAERELADLRRSLDDFERASGIRVPEWRGKRVGRALRAVLEVHDLESSLRRTLDQLTQARDRLANAIGSADIAPGDERQPPEPPF
jgi:GNAT superfamily N-acetyltransferase